MSFLRHMQTQQEHRQNGSVDKEVNAEGVRVKIRPARTGRNLPTAWDDKFPHQTRSWKAHRRSQFK